MTIPLVIIGAGGHGRELADLVAAVNGHERRYDLLGYLDDGEPVADRLMRQGLEHLGPLELLSDLPEPVRYVLGVGAGADRRHIDEWATALGREPVTLVHPTATVGSDVQLGDGAVICAHASVTTNVRFGRHVHLNVAAAVAHDGRLGDFVTLSPGSRLSGNVSLGDGVTVGTGAVIIPGVQVGRDTVIGAGAVVIRDVPPHVTAVGVPAHVIDPSL